MLRETAAAETESTTAAKNLAAVPLHVADMTEKIDHLTQIVQVLLVSGEGRGWRGGGRKGAD